MVLYGSRMYGRKDTVKGWGECENCGRYGEIKSYDGKKWGHLYYIPLIPLGKKVRVLKECKICNHGMHVPIENVPRMLEEIKTNSERALTALLEGKKEFDINGKPNPPTAYLVGSVEILLCLLADDHVNSILSSLKSNGKTHAYQLMKGRLLEYQGRLEEAAAAYNKAIQMQPGDVIALHKSGKVHVKMKDFQTAKQYYEKALSFAQNKLPIYSDLIGVYKALKEHNRLVDAYEQCFRLVPALKDEKKFFRAYKKACKKIGKKPVVV